MNIPVKAIGEAYALFLNRISDLEFRIMESQHSDNSELEEILTLWREQAAEIREFLADHSRPATLQACECDLASVYGAIICDGPFDDTGTPDICQNKKSNGAFCAHSKACHKEIIQ